MDSDNVELVKELAHPQVLVILLTLYQDVEEIMEGGIRSIDGVIIGAGVAVLIFQKCIPIITLPRRMVE